ncbi:hypothetical protein ARAM_004318 [Aspergillus rambellii]|uniref:TIM-barrel domain-containing protein n=1 Tax=Aspergillus rambellii TaxID=308745 RepID=A0A0F8WTX0_9EURO|nr:hypothetical protein ARAM_004318 [Aspergillus rambellii]
MPHIILLGTLDTKLSEILYLHDQLKETAARLASPLQISLIDCGRQAVNNPAITVSHTDLIAKYASGSRTQLLGLPRGQVIEFMIDCVSRCVEDLTRTDEIHGIIGAGGSGGTSLISAVMRKAAPIGLPKLIVSTIASGDTGPVVGECDISMMYSVVDIAGMNQLLGKVLGNAAGAMVGMASAYEHRLRHATPAEGNDGKLMKRKTRVGITMFGVTTPCVDRIRHHLEEKYSVEVYVFHATGHGGMAMERLVEEGHLDAILDITTTEICDLVAGGNMRCDRNRLEATLKRGIPNIISVGATDMVNFGPVEAVPAQYRGRKLMVHNPTVTLMRTSPAECQQVGDFILDKLHTFTQNPEMVEVWLPRGGVSLVSTAGSTFMDAEADGILANTLSSGLKGRGIRVVSDERDINDGGFAVAIAESLMTLIIQGDSSHVSISVFCALLTPLRLPSRSKRLVRPNQCSLLPLHSLATSNSIHIRLKMAPPTSRSEILARLRHQIEQGRPIVGAGAGIGLSAKSVEAGGGDLIVIYNSGRFRMAGCGSLAGLMPYSNANEVVVEMAAEVIPIVKNTPVVAGVCGTDPFKSMPKFLEQLKALGFAGVQNFPTVGLIDGQFRANLEETEMGYGKEVEMIRQAAQLGLLTTPYVFNVEEAIAMTKAGADILVAHMGLTTSGLIGARTGKSLDQCVSDIQAIRDTAVKLNPDIIVLCHGGPIARPEDARFILERVQGVHGFYGASSMERLPVEIAIKNTTADFKSISLKK